MGKTLFGGVESGTPLETRAGSEQMAKFFENMMRGGNFQKMGSQSFANLFGMNPGDTEVSNVVQQMLADPASQTRGLFASMRPFEQRAVGDARSETRNMFGTAGGRFSRNLADAESRAVADLNQGFARSREEALLGAQGQRGNFLAQLFQLANQDAQTGLGYLGTAAQFLQPGAPIVREGLIPGLISAAGNMYGMSKMFPGGGGGNIPGAPNVGPPPKDPFRPGGPYWNPNGY